MVASPHRNRATVTGSSRPFLLAIVVVATVATSACGHATSAAGPLRARRAPTSSTPLRVDLIGDSMAAALAGGFSSTLQAAGAAPALNRGWWGFGFTSGWTEVARDGKVILPPEKFFSGWPQHYAQFVADDDPDAFVAYVGGWDLGSRVVNGRVLAAGSPAWRVFYAGLLDHAVSILTRRGAIVYFLSPPCDGEGPNEKGYNQGSALLRQMFSAVAARHPHNVATLDLNSLLCPSGKPSNYATTANGTTVRVLDNHFTTAGAKLVGAWFIDQVTTTWHLRPLS